MIPPGELLFNIKNMNIILADQQVRVRFALRVLLEQQQDWRVIGEASNTDELIIQVQRKTPDLIVMDGKLPGTDAINCISVIRQVCPKARIVTLSIELPATSPNLGNSADAYTSKANSPDHLLSIIRKFS